MNEETRLAVEPGLISRDAPESAGEDGGPVVYRVADFTRRLFANSRDNLRTPQRRGPEIEGEAE